MDRNLTQVPQTAKPVREIHQGWIEPSVWTERMLKALEEGVKGGRQRWPNAYFAQQGLFSMAAACEALRQSCYR